MVMMPEDGTARPLAAGVTLARLKPGGRDGPDGAVLHSDQLGGGLWTEMFALGRPEDPWRLAIPDIRMARNQYWPLHWHDCWIAVVILDGGCLIGDWFMQPGDVLVSPARVEYGPVLNGPKGCQLLEVFARDIDAPGGYAPEFHDHPTLVELQGARSGGAAFLSRPEGSEGNVGSQTTPLAGVPGLLTGHLQGGQRWELGPADDPERGVLLDTKLAPAVAVPVHRHRDWRGVLVLEGEMAVGGHGLAKDDLLLIEPDVDVPAFSVGSSGVHLLELARTTATVPTVFRAAEREALADRNGLAAAIDAVYE